MVEIFGQRAGEALEEDKKQCTPTPEIQAVENTDTSNENLPTNEESKSEENEVEVPPFKNEEQGE